MEVRRVSRLLIQPAAVLQRHDAVAVAVEKQRRDRHAADLRLVIQPAPDERTRHEPVVHPRHLPRRAESRLEHQRAGRPLQGHLGRHRPSQRAAEQHDAPRRHPAGGNGVVDGQPVEIDARFVRRPRAAAVAAVVDEHDADAQVVHEPARVGQPVGDVAGIAVEPDQHPVARAGYPPAMEHHAVVRRDCEIFRAESEVSRLGRQRTGRKKEQPALVQRQPADERQPGENDVQRDRHDSAERSGRPHAPTDCRRAGSVS